MAEGKRRWRLAEAFGGARFVHGPEVGRVARVKVMPVSEHEAALAKARTEAGEKLAAGLRSRFRKHDVVGFSQVEAALDSLAKEES